jgi:hypothetical protein
MKNAPLLNTARNEKDVENAYRAEILSERPDAKITSPYGSDGYARWGTVRALLEFKYDLALKGKAQQAGVLGQMLLYVKKFSTAGEVLPNVLFVGDRNECFALSMQSVQQFLDLPIDWSVAPSQGHPELTRAITDDQSISPFVFDVADLNFREVLAKIETLALGEVHQVRATLGNIGSMFIFWRDNIFVKGSNLTSVEQVDLFLKCLFRPDDVVSHPSNTNLLVSGGVKIPVNGHQYRSFIQHFVRGYKPSEIEAFYAAKDRLVEDDARRRQGAFFTPQIWVDEAHRMLEAELGQGWRDECIVYDPACGTGNLTRDYTFKDLILSTAEKPDVEVIKEQGYNPGASVFAYDFLNDDSSPFFDGKNVIPDAVDERLRAAAKAGKRLVFFMNPPYGTANNAGTVEGDSKAGIALTSVNAEMKRVKIGGASQQLYAQFMCRCTRLAETYGFAKVTTAVYCKPTFMCSGSYKGFRDFWYKRFQYKTGMLFQASHFADVSGAWGISFTVWSEGKQDTKVAVPVALKDVKDFVVVKTADKLFYNSDGSEASDWVREPTKGMKGVDAPQMSSGLKVTGVGRMLPGSILGVALKGNNLQDAGTGTWLQVGDFTGHTGKADVLPGESFRRATALYAVRKLVTGTWVNDKDEYLRPLDTTPAYKQWNDDAIVYALLHGSNNCTAMRNVKYKGKDYRIKNHFWHRTLKDTKALYDQAGCSDLYRDVKAETEDAYLATILPTLDLSPEARLCLAMYDKMILDTLPHRESFATAQPELHLTAHDAGLYQLKHLFRAHAPEDYKAFSALLKNLANKLRPGVYEHGFLRA